MRHRPDTLKRINDRLLALEAAARVYLRRAGWRAKSDGWWDPEGADDRGWNLSTAVLRQQERDIAAVERRPVAIINRPFTMGQHE